LSQRGYKIVFPASGKPQNAPQFNYFRTTVYYDGSQPRAHTAAASIGDLFGDAAITPLSPGRMAALANGAMTTVVVGQNFHGTLAPIPVDKTPKKEPPQVTPNAAMTRSLLMSVRRRVPFRLEFPRLVERNSRLASESPVRVHTIKKGHNAVRLTFVTGGN